MTTTFKDPVTITGPLKVTGTIEISQGITDSDVGAAADIQATKLQHQHHVGYHQDDGSDIVAATAPIYICRGASGTTVAIQISCADAPSGGDKAFSVDLYKSDVVTGEPAVTILNAPIAYSATQTDFEVEVGVVDTAALTVGDTLLVVVAVSGSTGTQGQGLQVSVTVREDAD